MRFEIPRSSSMIPAMSSPRRCGWVTLLVLVGGLLLAATPAAADEPSDGWAFYGGIYDTVNDDNPLELGVEYRFRTFELFTLDIEPAVGVAGTEDENAWVYLSFRWDWPLGERWTVTPQTGISLYEQGDGKDLGGVVEFRSGLEIAYRLPGGSQLGLLFYHLSNADIYDENPGSNSLVLIWSLGR